MTLKQMVAQSENLFISQQHDGTFFPGLESCVISSGLTFFSLKSRLNFIVMILQCPIWDVKLTTDRCCPLAGSVWLFCTATETTIIKSFSENRALPMACGVWGTSRRLFFILGPTESTWRLMFQMFSIWKSGSQKTIFPLYTIVNLDISQNCQMFSQTDVNKRFAGLYCLNTVEVTKGLFFLECQECNCFKFLINRIVIKIKNFFPLGACLKYIRVSWRQWNPMLVNQYLVSSYFWGQIMLRWKCRCGYFEAFVTVLFDICNA